MKPEKLAAGRYRYRGRYLIRTTWGPGPRGGEKPRWEVADDDAYGGVTIQGTFTHRTMKEAMTEIDEGPEYKIVPAHINETTGMFCSGGGLATANGRCQHGCDHAEHYSNDGHPECEDRSGEPGWQANITETREAIAEQEAYIERFKAEKNGRCEETVVRDGQPGVCDRPLDARGYCGHERDHVT